MKRPMLAICSALKCFEQMDQASLEEESPQRIFPLKAGLAAAASLDGSLEATQDIPCKESTIGLETKCERWELLDCNEKPTPDT
jgi:hypothetical protein